MSAIDPDETLALAEKVLHDYRVGRTVTDGMASNIIMDLVADLRALVAERQAVLGEASTVPPDLPDDWHAEQGWNAAMKHIVRALGVTEEE